MHFSEKDYKQEYAYDYSKEYFKDKLINNFSVVNFALSNQEATKKKITIIIYKRYKETFLSNN